MVSGQTKYKHDYRKNFYLRILLNNIKNLYRNGFQKDIIS